MASISPERLAAIEREKNQNASGGGANFFSMKDMQKAVIRLCPSGEANIGTKCVSYFINKRSYVCNEHAHGRPGVIANAIRALAKLSSDPEAQEVREALEANRRTSYLMKILVLDPEDHTVVERGPVWFRSPRSDYDAILKVFLDDKEPIDDIAEGSNIRISKSGSGLQTEYSVRVLAPTPMPGDKAERKTLMDAAEGMDVADLLRPDEAGALEALQSTIPKDLWRKVSKAAVDGTSLAEDADGDADASKDDDADPAPRKKAAVATEEEEEPPRKKKPVDEEEAPVAKKRPVADDEEDAPVAKKRPPVDEDDPPPRKKAPVDEDDAPPVKKKAAPVDEDDPPPRKKASVDEDEPAPKRKPAPVDDEDAPPRKRVVQEEEDAPPVKKKPSKYDE